MVRVMFVCLGNICRSPTAHGLFAARVAESGLQEQILVSSSGTAGWHIGKPPDPRSVAAAKARGIDIGNLRAQQVCPADFHTRDYVLAMDRQNLSDLQAMAPGDTVATVDLFLRFAANSNELEVPDPYYGGTAGFTRVLELVEDASQGLLDHIRRSLHASG